MIEIHQPRFFVSDSEKQKCLAALEKILESGESGFPKIPHWDSIWIESKQVGDSLRRRFENLILLGTGGSSLGTQVIANMRPGTRLRFLENVDAEAAERAVYGLDLARTGILIVSKSGGTGETLAGTDYLKEVYARAGVSFYERCHVLTESAGSALGKWANEKKAALTKISPEIGGRYSVLSHVGMIPACFDGYDIASFREGAALAMGRREFAAELMAHFLKSFERREWITFFWFYDPLARIAGLWLQQLWAESLGKKKNRQGGPAPRASTPMAGLGTVDQHSVLQQVIEGPRDKFVVFLRSDAAETKGPALTSPDFQDCAVLKGQSMGALLQVHAIANEQSLHGEGVSTMTLKTEVLDERGLGELIMLMQMIVAGLGAALDIDPFDQPGVELGKRLAKELLKKA
ncbi:MAG TPA: glucose-6-phosphate isomerase [Pseudobdellovibrionaceae bacterium]|nr:glucose-6-phosphate isomerase [Pseudobdellovibrionaceae bacterium]